MKFGIVNITSFCNQACPFCSEGDMHKNPKHIKYDEVINILDGLKSDGVDGINFMGGECTLRSDLGKILDYCNNKFKVISIVTNGVMFLNYDYANSILSKINSFELSWHTNDKYKFRLLSSSDTFDKFQLGLINIFKILDNNKNLNCVINHVINKINYMDLVDFVEEVNKKIIYKDNVILALKRTNIIGYALKNKDMLSVSSDKVFPYLYKAIQKCIENKITVQIEGFPPCLFKDFFNSPFFNINELDNDDLYLLNKIDISSISKESVRNFKFNKEFNKNIYSNKNYNKDFIISVIKKCSSCKIRETCHKSILLGEDANLLDKEILNIIGNEITLQEIIENHIKRKKFKLNMIKNEAYGN